MGFLICPATGEKLKSRLDHLETLAASITGNKSGLGVETTVLSPSPEGAVISQDNDSNDVAINERNDFPQTRLSPDSYSSKPSLTFSDVSFSTALTAHSSSDITLWDPTTPIDPSYLFHNGSDPLLGSGLQVGFVDCGCLKPHVQMTCSSPKEYKDLKILDNIDTAIPLADPYLNAIRVEQLCLIQAIKANCLHIGITDEMFCDDDAVSPFFRPLGSKSGSDGVVVSIQSIFKTLKKDVRPVKEQITTTHHPVVDVLPFPTFRRNWIRNADTVDEDELYDDLLNGLLCWGGSGVGRKERNSATGITSTGTPWDGRSWEARTWFLRKYWALLGGEEGELVQQSEWWRNVRGEETDLWTAL